MPLILYQKDDCQLCDEAWEVLAAAGIGDFESVWIEDSPDLQSRYGQRVPVLQRRDTSAELGWPFSAADVRQFLL